ncbi:MAG: alpha/beta hydrolase [Bacilli bacterium]|nr:alpha/beta hydrolase [Bacilli bacterium]
MKSILLLHGWNDENYTSQTDSKDAWDNRKVFVDKLSKDYKIYKLNFPGFCGQPEPDKAWYLKDYVEYVFKYIKDNNLKVDYILGYSFGGAVATLYNVMKDPTQKIILISPAIARNGVTTKIHNNPLRNKLRNIYLKYIVKNKYMIHGTKFLNDSYQNILRIELIKEVNLIKPDLLTIIYGSEDNMVNPNYVINNLDEEHKKRVYMVDGGSHDIANSHPDDIISILTR